MRARDMFYIWLQLLVNAVHGTIQTNIMKESHAANAHSIYHSIPLTIIHKKWNGKSRIPILVHTSSTCCNNVVGKQFHDIVPAHTMNGMLVTCCVSYVKFYRCRNVRDFGRLTTETLTSNYLIVHKVHKVQYRLYNR